MYSCACSRLRGLLQQCLSFLKIKNPVNVPHTVSLFPQHVSRTICVSGQLEHGLQIPSKFGLNISGEHGGLESTAISVGKPETEITKNKIANMLQLFSLSEKRTKEFVIRKVQFTSGVSRAAFIPDR